MHPRSQIASCFASFLTTPRSHKDGAMYLYCVSASREYSLPNPPKEGFNTNTNIKKR